MTHFRAKFFIITMVITLFTFAPSFSEDNPLYIHGFISQGYLNSSSNNYLINTEPGTFQFGEVGINFTKQTSDNLRLAAQLIMKNFGDNDDQNVEIDWAFGDYQVNENFGFRAGRIKTPRGLYGKIWDMDFLRTAILLPSGFYDEEAKQTTNALNGFEIYGSLFTDNPNNFEYEILYGSEPLDEEAGFMKMVEDKFSATSLSTSNNYTLYTNLVWNTSIEGLKLAYTNMKSDHDVDFETTSTAGITSQNHYDIDMDDDLFSLEFTKDRIKFNYEWARSDSQMIDTTTNALTFRDTETWYALVDYVLDDRFTLGTYYSEYYPDRHDKDGTNSASAAAPAGGAPAGGAIAGGAPAGGAPAGGTTSSSSSSWLKEKTITLKYNIKENWNIKAEVHFMEGSAKVYPWFNTDGIDEDWTLYALKTTYNF